MWKIASFPSNEQYKRFRDLALIGFTIMLLMTLFVQVKAEIGLGGLISEKLVTLGSDSNLWVARSTNMPLLVGMGAEVTTGAATGVDWTLATATLNGSLDDLNGLGAAEVWFEWGYTAACTTGSTAHTTLAAPANHSAAINGFANQRIYYRLVGQGDGIIYGDVESFVSAGTGSALTGSNIIWTVVPVIIAAAIFIFMVKSGAPINVIIAFVVVAILCLIIIRAMLGV